MLAFFLTIYSEAVCFVAALLFTSVWVLSFLCNLIRQTARCSLLPLEVGAKAVVRLWPICLHISRIFDAMRSSTLPRVSIGHAHFHLLNIGFKEIFVIFSQTMSFWCSVHAYLCLIPKSTSLLCWLLPSGSFKWFSDYLVKITPWSGAAPLGQNWECLVWYLCSWCRLTLLNFWATSVWEWELGCCCHSPCVFQKIWRAVSQWGRSSISRLA